MNHKPKARKGEFVSLLAARFGVTESAILYPVRVLQKHKIIPTGTKGFGGVAMTAQSCADGMIVGAVAQRPHDPVEVWQRYSALPSVYSSHALSRNISGVAEQVGPEADDSGALHFPGFNFPTLQALGAGHSFRDALAALIHVATTGEITHGHHADYPDASLFYTLDVSLSGPHPAASIALRISGWLPDHSVPFVYHELADYLMESNGGGPDLQITRKFTHATIDDVASLLRA